MLGPRLLSLSSDNSIGREELFYQLALRQFGDFSRMKLQPPPSLRSLLQIAVNAEPSTKQSKLTKDQIVDVRFLSHLPCLHKGSHYAPFQ